MDDTKPYVLCGAASRGWVSGSAAGWEMHFLFLNWQDFTQIISNVFRMGSFLQKLAVCWKKYEEALQPKGNKKSPWGLSGGGHCL